MDVLKCRILSGIAECINHYPNHQPKLPSARMSNSRPDHRGNPIDFIRTLADVAGGLGNWIANGTPDPDSIPGEIQKRYRDHCDAYSNGPSWIQQFDPGARLFLDNACKPWLDSQNSGPPGSVPPFTGGQCPFTYNVRLAGTVVFNGEDPINLPFLPRTLPVLGPVSGPAFRASTGGNPLNTDVGFIDGNGDFIGFSVISRQAESFEVEVISITPTGGQDDDCGDPPAEPTPNPNPRPMPDYDPEDEPFEREPGRPVLPMPRITNPFGQPVQLPNFPLPNVEGPSLYPEDEPPLAVPGEPGTPKVVGGDSEAEGEADADETLTGVLVEVTTAPSYARTVQNVSIPTYIGACYVYLGWENQLDLQPEGQFLVDGQFFAAIPGMTHWLVRSAVGYTLTITPYYAPKE